MLEDVVWRHRNLRVAPQARSTRSATSTRSAQSTVTFGVGPAGTGKTFLAMAMATAALQRREVNRIILTRPAVEAGERLGFLPGDLMAKVDPYLRPLFDALHDMMDAEKVASHLEKGVIEVAPLAFMRGRTLNDSFVILDEAQNTTPEQMKMFLTRLGFGSKMVVTGDVTQVDLPRDQKSGLIVVGDILEASRASSSCASAARTSSATSSSSGSSAAYDRALRAGRAGAAARRSPPPDRLAGPRARRRGHRGRPAGGRRSGVPPCSPRRSGGVDDGHVAVEFVDAGADHRAQRRPPRQGRPDRRPLVPRRRGRRARSARASSATS